MIQTVLELFQNGKEFDQILFIDNFYQRISLEEETQERVSKLLSTAIIESTNSYVRRTAFKIFCDLTLAKKITNRYSALSHLYSFLNCSDDTLQVIALKYLPYFPEALIDNTKEILVELSDSNSGEVASQAYLCLGLLKLEHLTSTTSINITLLINNLSQAKLYFQAAAQSIENRVDSQFYLILICWIESVLSGDSPLVQAKFNELEKNLQIRSLYEYEKKSLELDYLVFQLTQQIKTSFNTAVSSKEWYEIQRELKTLLILNLESQKLINAPSNSQAVLHRMFVSTFEAVQNIIYQKYLTPEKPRFIALKSNISDSQLVQFIEHLLTILPNDTEIRADNPELLSLLSEILGSESGLEVYQQVMSKEISLEKAVAELLRKNRSNQLHFKTGSIIGQEVLLSLMKQMNSYLPDYPPLKREAFFNVVEEVIRYARTTFTGQDKKRFLFLYSETEGGKGKTALEQDLQDNMYIYMQHSKIADGLEHEKAKFVDGGRVDILYQKDIITIPIELKKSLNRPDKETLEKNYIAQAQTYTAGYDQLGIFVLLELSDKSTEPQPNFKDWFKVHHISPSSNQIIEYPDYIISVVIPGNKTTPSAKSTYK